MRKELEDSLGILATDNYGMSELIGPGVSGECVYQCGMHISEDHFIPEIIDPATGEVLPAGSWGELVVTTITKEALPVLRYRTTILPGSSMSRVSVVVPPSGWKSFGDARMICLLSAG